MRHCSVHRPELPGSSCWQRLPRPDAGWGSSELRLHSHGAVCRAETCQAPAPPTTSSCLGPNCRPCWRAASR